MHAEPIQPLPLRALAPWAVAGALLLLLLYVVTLDQGALTRAGDLVHDVLHDGRHLLAVPCH